MLGAPPTRTTEHAKNSSANLAAIILAAGASRRMGTPKPLLPYAGGTFLEQLLEATRHPRVGVTRVVLGAQADEVLAQVRLEPSTVVINPEWEKGQLSSIQAGLRSLPAGSTAGILLCPVDHPFVAATTIATLIRKFESAPEKIVLPTCGGKRGHPVIFPSHLYPELLSAPVETGARAVVWAHAADLVEVPSEDEGVLLNLNDPETMRRAISARQRGN